MKTFDERRACVEQYIGKIKRKRRRNVAVATGLCLVLAMVLFIPYNTTPPDVSMYADSEYYGLIQRLNEATYQASRYKNNFEALVHNLDFSVGKGGSSMEGANSNGMPMAPGNAPSSGNQADSTNGNYEEVTDNQVEGVVEADLLKRSDKYAFYLRGKELAVYSIDGDESKLLTVYPLGGVEEFEGEGKVSYASWREMYLSQDCNTLTLIQTAHSTCFSDNTTSCTVVSNLDVSDPKNITVINKVYFTGRYVSSRMVDGDILLVYNHLVYAKYIDFDDPATFVPQYGVPGDMTCIASEQVVCPDSVGSSSYAVISRLDGQTLDVQGSTALLSYSNELYVSEDTIYATHSYSERNQETFDIKYQQKTMTEITGISYAGGGLKIQGTIALEGRVKDQYSMDQYQGILRVVTSTTVSYFVETFYGEFASNTTSAVDRNVNLYCIDLANWEIAAEVIAFAPEGEDAQSVRFDGYNAYVCTAEVITITDPVYFFDLSDLEHITWKDTGTIEGYSTSLIQLGDGYLLGIGRGGSSALKIEVYAKTEDSVVSVCTYERNAIYSTEYKSYLIDREHDRIGLHILDWEVGLEAYVVLHFNGSQLQEIRVIPVDAYGEGNTRAFIAGDYLYVFSDADTNNFSVTKIA